MFIKKLERSFIIVIAAALLFLVKSNYDNYKFDHEPVSKEIKQRIEKKEKEILTNMQKNYGFAYKVPIIITDKIPSKLYGLTSFKNGIVKIYLNKKVMKESMEYMVNTVLPHEYAHALLFKERRLYSSASQAHGRMWQQACIALGGKDCEQFVNHDDVVLGKLPF